MFFLFFKFTSKRNSSTYALNLISLYLVRMLASLLKAIRKNTTDMGNPCGIPFSKGCMFELCVPIRTVIFLFLVKFIMLFNILWPHFHFNNWSIID